MNYDSKTEKDMAPTIAALGGRRCTTFPGGMPDAYLDASGEQHTARPDFTVPLSTHAVLIEAKGGSLNNHYTHASSTDALKDAYRDHFYRSGDSLTHSQLSNALFYYTRRGQLDALRHGFHHSRWKQAAVQAVHGWQRFILVFKTAPCKYDAEQYCKAGIVFCTLKTLPDLLLTIELSQKGFLIPFVFQARSYSFSVMPDPASRNLSAEMVQANDRAKLMAAVAADREAIAAQEAQQEADEAAGLLPF